MIAQKPSSVFTVWLEMLYREEPGNRFNYAKCDYIMLRESVQSLNISDKIRNMDVTDAWNTVKKGCDDRSRKKSRSRSRGTFGALLRA